MDNKLNIHEDEFLGSGWAFPITFSVGNHQLKLSRYENNINESIRIILFTNRGERIMNYDFGSGLQQYFFRKMDATLKGEIKDTIYFSLLSNEPRISVQEVLVNYPNLMDGIIMISITYILNLTNTRHNYVFPFHVLEGTNIKELNAKN